MTAWDILTSHSSNTGDAWFRLNNISTSTVVINNGQASGVTANSPILFDTTPVEINLNMSNPEVIFDINPTIVSFSTTPTDYQFNVTIPVVNLEA